MSAESLVGLALQSLLLCFYLSLPALAAALLAALLSGVFQAVTQLQDPALAFVPKLLAGGLALYLFAPWMLAVATQFWQQLWTQMGAPG